MDKISAFFNNIGVSNIKEGYTINGKTTQSYFSAPFASCLAVTAMNGSDALVIKIFIMSVLKESGNKAYFSYSLRMMALL